MHTQLGGGVALAAPESAFPKNACGVYLPKSTTVAARGLTRDDVEEPPLARRISHSYGFALKHDHETNGKVLLPPCGPGLIHVAEIPSTSTVNASTRQTD